MNINCRLTKRKPSDSAVGFNFMENDGRFQADFLRARSVPYIALRTSNSSMHSSVLIVVLKICSLLEYYAVPKLDSVIPPSQAADGISSLTYEHFDASLGSINPISWNNCPIIVGCTCCCEL